MPLRGVLCFTLALIPGQAAAHAFGSRYDLPLPLALWLWTAGATVALSFVVFAFVLHRCAGTLSYPRRDLPAAHWLAHPFVIAMVRVVSVGIFVALLAAGWFGTQDP